MDACPIPAKVDRSQRWFLAALVLFFVSLSIQYTYKICDDHHKNRSAFLRWREQLLELDQGVDIYQRHNYPNPPIMAILLEPLTQLPPLMGALIWFYLKVAMALLAIAMVFRLIETHERRFPAWGKGLAVVLSMRPIMGDLSHGNVNLFILFLVVAALFAYRHRRDLGCGVLIGLAVACKVTPALFLPYFVWKRAWKTVAGCGAGLVLFFWLVPGLLLGFDKNGEYLGSWVERMVKPFVVNGEVWSELNNQSVPGLVQRLLTEHPSISPHDEAPEYHNFAALAPLTARWLVKALMGAFALLIVWSCRTPTMPRANWRLAAEFALIVLGMLLFSERTWKHHCVTLLLPFSVVAYYLSAIKPPLALRVYLIASLTAVVLLMTSTSTGMFDELERAAKLAQVYGAYVWAYLVLAAALIVLLKQPQRAAQTVALPAPKPALRAAG